MAYGEPINVMYFEFLNILFPILLCIYVIFSALSLSKYMNNKSTLTLYFGFTNIIFSILFVVMDIGIIDSLNYGFKTDVYYFSILFMNIGIIIASILFYQFYGEIISLSRKNKIFMTIFGISIIIFQLTLWNLWFPTEPIEGMQLTHVSQMIQTLFCIYVYLSMAREFLKLSKRAQDRTKELNALGIASLLMLIFFTLMLIRVALMRFELIVLIVQISSWIVLVISTSCFFYGLIVPNLKKSGE